MMKVRACAAGWACAIAVLLSAAAPAGAVIKADKPLGQYCDETVAICVGKITSVDADKSLAVVAISTAIKGDRPADEVRIQIVKPADLIKELSPDMPVCIVILKPREGQPPRAMINIADTWTQADISADAKPPLYRIRSTEAQDANLAFPGRTKTLVTLLDLYKAGKSMLLNTVDNRLFTGGVKELGSLRAKATFLLAGDLDGDGKPELVAGGPDGVSVYAPADGGYKDVTKDWSLPAGGAKCAALGDADGDGKLDLLLDGMLFRNEGKAFAAPVKIGDVTGDILACCLADIDGDKRPDALYLSADGKCLVFANPGKEGSWTAKTPKAVWTADDKELKGQMTQVLAAVFGDWGDNGRLHVMVVRANGITRYPLDADGGTSDLLRLTGKDQAAIRKDLAKAMWAAGVALDMDASGAKDLLVLTETGGLALANRGFGCYLPHPDAPKAFFSDDKRKVPFAMDGKPVFAAVDLAKDKYDDVLVLTPDGKLFLVDNPPPAK